MVTIVLVEDEHIGVTDSAGDLIATLNGAISTKHTYADESGFSQALGLAASGLSRGGLLVISAHGVPATGTHLSGGIDLQRYRKEFSRFGVNCVVLLRSCWGGYPSVLAIHGGRVAGPIIIGPLVDISIRHADELLRDLVAELVANNTSDHELIAFVATREKELYPDYSDRTVLRVISRDGRATPQFGVGGFAGPRYDNIKFTVMAAKQGFSGDRNDHVRLILQSSGVIVDEIDDVLWLLPAATSAYVLSELGVAAASAVGVVFFATFTIKREPYVDEVYGIGEAVEFDRITYHSRETIGFKLGHEDERDPNELAKPLKVIQPNIAKGSCIRCCYGALTRTVAYVDDVPQLRTESTCSRRTCVVLAT